jgi:acyl transferase domain-containing protein/3-hydroxymyristoyl/3-hydroxydecanoyl-(acyl carrier protein) dehydratase
MDNHRFAPIAIVGAGGIFPGAPDLSTFWQNIVNRRSAIVPIPAERWPVSQDRVYSAAGEPDKARSLNAGLIQDLPFQNDDGPFPPAIMSGLDPMHHLVLAAGQSAWNDCQHGPVDPERVDVVLAAIALPTESASRLTRQVLRQAAQSKLFPAATRHLSADLSFQDAMASGVTSLPGSLLGAALGLGGSTLTLDAACASSLFAVKLACDALQAGRTDAVLAGGVARPDTLYTQIGFTQLQALSHSGRCAPFDRSADGLVVGEGCGLVVLKRLEDALRHGDRIYALVRAAGLSNDRRGNLLAPDAEGQVRAMQAAYAAAGWQPSDIDLIECHGAATPVGDATELRSLTDLWGKDGWHPGQCAIGSVKSMIGHLLTAAGAAGLIKVLLGIQHQTLPPSLNFQEPAPDSPLPGSPFHVQTAPAPWQPRGSGIPRRAAVSAFGFGGINAHILLEEWHSSPNATNTTSQIDPVAITGTAKPSEDPVAVVGMEAFFGPARGLASFREVIFKGQPVFRPPSHHRWKHCDETLQHYLQREMPLSGGFLDDFQIDLADFRIPPKEIPDILPQHLLMLKVARGAMTDVGQHSNVDPIRMGCVIGMEFDLEDTNFHLRWDAHRVAEKWNTRYGLALSPDQIDEWATALADMASPPLTHTRTLGSLGSLIASRIAREFHFGGPSFIVSADAVSGLQALSIAARMLNRHDVDQMLVGAVDLPGDLRRLIKTDRLASLAKGNVSHNLARRADVTLPGEGGAAVVLKRLTDARRSGDRIYAVIRGFGSMRQGIPFENDHRTDACTRALSASLADAAIPPESIGYLETHGSGHPADDRAEYDAINTVFKPQTTPLAIGATMSCIGHGGAAAGLASLVKAVLCLHDKTIAPMSGYQSSQKTADLPDPVRGPAQTVSWPATRSDTPRRACLNTISDEGHAMSVVLEEAPEPDRATLQAVTATKEVSRRKAHPVTIVCGGLALEPPQPPGQGDTAHRPAPPVRPSQPEVSAGKPEFTDNAAHTLFTENTRTLINDLTTSMAATTDAHQQFLSLAEDLGRQHARTIALQTRLIHQAHTEGLLEDRSSASAIPDSAPPFSPPPIAKKAESSPPPAQPVAFDRDMCMEFAVGSVAKVLGPAFAAVDHYPARVRLPDEPLMLVDRILSVEGEKGVLGPGRLVTEHDVHADAWYLDGDRAPVCISVEAGQADLFLSAYLGIDLEVKGKRTYRLLDATVTFHRGLPRPGDVIRYTIEIEKFIRQGPTWLFFFRFDGSIEGDPLITMRNGCAGFFTEEEVRNSGGIILTEDDVKPQPGIAPHDWQPLVAMSTEAYDESGLEALRRGDIGACFGAAFAGIELPASQRLPGGRMALIDRVLSLDPAGGRCGLGTIRAEADIHPDDWFLTCHFVDDMVMPGTLMYECCAHTLRIYLQRMGWISHRPEVVFEPVMDRPAVLKCRGPVTPRTRHVVYEVEICELGFNPEPYVIADAHMFADDHRIVLFQGMTMKMTGMDRAALENFWSLQARTADAPARETVPPPSETIVFSRDQIVEFATGMPSKVFGSPYRPFDHERFIARLPRPPYAFIHRITRIDPPPWVLAPDGWVETVCEISPEDWFFRSNHAPFMPICILMEIALQACGFLAAYMGSALQSDKDLHFRNLDGEATLHANARSTDGPLRTRARLIQYSAAGDMLIQHYAFDVHQAGRAIYDGKTSFGFFTPEALAHQVGLPEADQPAAGTLPHNDDADPPIQLEDTTPLTPDDPQPAPGETSAIPSRALRMIDCIDCFAPDGGAHGLGYVRGAKTIDPDEWFFKAHFYQDPVCPGSLGIESFIQLLRFAAHAFWPEYRQTHTMELLTPEPHTWRYRGQILPTNRRVEVEAMIIERQNQPCPCIKADGYLKSDGLYLYKMHNFGLRLIPRDIQSGP